MCCQEIVNIISDIPPTLFISTEIFSLYTLIISTKATLTSQQALLLIGQTWAWSSFISPSVCLNLLPGTKCWFMQRVNTKFSLKTHTFILLMRGRNYLGSIHLDDGFVFCCAGQQMCRQDAIMHRMPGFAL